MIIDRLGNVIEGNVSQDKLLKKLYSTSFGRCALKILTTKFVSVVGGLYMSSFLSKRQINSFIENNHIDMSQYEDKRYRSYNDFFTRKIKDNKREIVKEDNVLIAPCDSKLSYYPITEDCLLTIKDTTYKLQDLLQDNSLAKEYLGGTCLIFRLTVDDYHRYSYLDSGSVISNNYIKGVFHTVNPIANDYYPIYKTNSREVTVIKTVNFSQVVYVEVGAMMVGKIKNHHKEVFTKGEEKGYFEFGGSTIVVLLKQDKVIIDDDIINNSKDNNETRVLLGQRIGIKGE